MLHVSVLKFGDPIPNHSPTVEKFHTQDCTFGGIFPATLYLDRCVVRPYATRNRKCYQIWEFLSSHTKHLQRSAENLSCDNEPTVCCSMQNLTFIDASCCSRDQKQQNGPKLESVDSHVQPFTGHAEIWHAWKS